MSTARYLIVLFSLGIASAQHGVIREYAALAPKPDAVPLRPLFDEPLTDTSITLGPDKAYYLTGSAVNSDGAVFSHKVVLWRSTDMRKWKRVREMDFAPAAVRAPEIHYLQGRFWLTLGMEGGGTELLRFDNANIASSRFERRKITDHGEDPSLFLDDDGTYYWVMGAGEVARMKPDPLEGLAAEPKAMIAAREGDVRSARMHGAYLARIDGYYHLFVAERRLSHEDLGRTGLPGGTDDTFVAVSSHPDRDYGQNRYLAFPYAGQTTLFRDVKNALWATYSCTDTRGIFRLRPSAFPVEQVPATKPMWAIGFSSQNLDRPTKYQPQGMMLRPDTSFIYESGVGLLRPAAMEPVPGQSASFPWIRDPSIMRGPDGVYYMTGTSGNMDAIHLWRSTDMQHWRYVTAAYKLDANPQLWYNQKPGRFLWAPELHYLNGTYWIAWCVSGQMGIGLLKSTTGKPQGPYLPTYEGNRALIRPNIDASLFQDDNGTAYLVWQNGMIRKLNRQLSGFDGETFNLRTVDAVQVGYEGVYLCKIGAWYVLSASEWNGGGNRDNGTYDMMYAVSKKLEGPYSRRRVAVPHGGHETMFQDGAGRWYVAIFGNDRTAPFRALPGVVPMEVQESSSDLILRPR